MPRLSKLIALPAALCVAACLAVVPGVGQHKKPPHKTGNQMVTRLPALDPTLAPGNKFDQEIADALIPSQKPVNDWVKLPPEYAFTWKRGQTTQIFSNDHSGSIDREAHVSKPILKTLDLGSIKDRNGGLWQYQLGRFWDIKPRDTDSCLQLVGTLRPAPDGSLVLHHRMIVFHLDNETGNIFLLSQFEIFSTYRLIAPDVMHLIEKTNVFDWRGNLTNEWEEVSNFRKVGDFVPRPDGTARDGKPLYPLFVQFLKDNGMADRIPDAPQAAPGVVANP